MQPMDGEKINWPLLMVIIIGTFMAILDGSIVNVALPKICLLYTSDAADE